MKIAVMGAGAVGCYYGGMLARAGHDVALIGRPAHVDAIQSHGLLLETTTFKQSISVTAGIEPTLAADADLLLFCVKATDTDSAARSLAPHLGATTIAISMQNGVDNAERLRNIWQREVLPAVVYVAAEMAGPGHVRHHGRGELVLGPARDADKLVALFSGAGVPAQVSDNVLGALWAKLVVNCAYNALSAITKMPYGTLVRSCDIEDVMRDVLTECLAVAEAEGIVIPGDPWRAILGIAETMPTQRSSTAQDLSRQKRSEIDHLNGYIVRSGTRHGIATPVNRVLHALVKAEETRFLVAASE